VSYSEIRNRGNMVSDAVSGLLTILHDILTKGDEVLTPLTARLNWKRLQTFTRQIIELESLKKQVGTDNVHMVISQFMRIRGLNVTPDLLYGPGISSDPLKASVIEAYLDDITYTEFLSVLDRLIGSIEVKLTVARESIQDFSFRGTRTSDDPLQRIKLAKQHARRLARDYQVKYNRILLQ